MPSTPGGLPYPAPADKAAQGPAQLQALAAALDGKLAAPTFQVVALWLQPDGNGELQVTFDRLSTVQGAVAVVTHQAGDAIVSSLQGWTGNRAGFRFTRLGPGYTVNNTPWTYTSVVCAVGWGS
jgi:hypothetical protein